MTTGRFRILIGCLLLALLGWPLGLSAQPNRLKDKPTATTPAGDEWIYLDGATNGVRKLAPSFFQPADADLTAIAAVAGQTAFGRGLLAETSAATLKATLALGNVDNTSNATERAATATLTNKTINGANNTITLAPTAVTPGNYTNTNLTVGADGRITAASNGSGGGGGGASAWGGITGTLSAQTDLQTALNLKANTATTLAGYGVTDGIDGAPIQQYLTTGTAQFKPHAAIAWGNYGFFFDRESSLATRINSTNLRDKVNFTAGAMSEIVNGGDGFFYGISEQGTCPIFRFDPATLTTTTLVAASGIVAGVGGSIAADGAGNLYVVGSIAGTNANCRVFKFRISDGALLVNRLIVGKGWAHACRFAGGGLMLSGMGPSIGADNGWYAKLAIADLSDIIAPVSFSPPPGSEHLFVPTDDFANDNTYAYFVSESVSGLSGDNWMARVHLTTGAINYYAMPGGTISAAYLAVWDGGTRILIPQFLRRGKIAVFDTVAAIFSELPINVYGPINEMIRAGNSWLVSTYSNSAGNAEAGVVTRLNLGELHNFGPYMFPNGDIILPDLAQIYFGNGSDNGITKTGLGFESGTFTDLGVQRIANLTDNGLVKVSGNNGTLGVATPGVDVFTPTESTVDNGWFGIKLPEYDGSFGAGDIGLVRFASGQGLSVKGSNGLLYLGDEPGVRFGLSSPHTDQSLANDQSTGVSDTNTYNFGNPLSDLPVGAYMFEIVAHVDAHAVAGHKYRLVFTGDVVEILATVISLNLSTGANVISTRVTANNVAVGQAGATQVQTTIKGRFRVQSGTASMTAQFGQFVANSSVSTILTGSTLKIRPCL